MSSVVTDLLTKIGERLLPAAESDIGKLFIKGETGIAQQGPAAVMALQKVRAAEELADRMAGPHMQDWLDVAKGIPEGQVSNELKSGNITSNAAMVAKTKMANVFNDFVQQGLAKPSQFIKDYFPKMYPPEMFEGKAREDALQHLIKTGQASTRTEAERELGYITQGGGKFQNIEKRRLANLPGEREDNAVVSDYLSKGYKRLAEVQTFGPKDKELDHLLDQVYQENGGGSAGQKAKDYTQWILEHKLGRRIGLQGPVKGLGQTNAEKAFSSLEALTKLSLSAVNQGTQFVNIPLVTRGLSPMIRGMARMAADYGDAKRFAMESGAILHDVYNAARHEALNDLTVGGKVLQYTGFQKADLNLRILASETGRVAVQDAFEKLAKNPADKEAIQILHTLGVDSSSALQRGALTQDEILGASRRASDLSQFRSDITSVPPAWKASSYGRMLSMYKNYAYQQASFLNKFVLRPALEGDVKPLMYLSILFPTVGEVASDVGDLIRKGTTKERPKYEVDRIIDNMAHVGAFGIMYDAARSMSYNDRSAYWRFLGGPILSDVVDLSKMPIDALNAKHPLDNLGSAAIKKLTRSVPVIGPRAYYEMYGRKASGGKPPKESRLSKAVTKLTK